MRTDTQTTSKGLLLRRTTVFAKPVLKWYFLWVASMIGSVIGDTLVPILMQIGIDSFAIPNAPAGLGRYMMLWIPLIAFSAFCVWAEKVLSGKAWSGFTYELRRTLFLRLNNLSADYFDTARSGGILACFQSDVETIGTFFLCNLTKIIMEGGRIIFYIGAMLLLNWRLACVVLVLSPVFALLIQLIDRVTRKYERSVKHQSADMTATYTETVLGIRTVKSLHLEKRLLHDFSVQSGQYYHTQQRFAKAVSSSEPLIYNIGLLCTASVLIFGTMIQRNYGISLGTMAAFLVYAASLYSCINSVAFCLGSYQGCYAAMERYYALLDQESSVKDSQEIMRKFPTVASYTALGPLYGEIEFRNVTFSYTEESSLIRNLNLRIPVGQKVAFVGETGGGKTTIVNLACRFYEPLSGTILYDGRAHRELPIGYIYSSLGYVLQSPYLFSGSIMENAKYGNAAAKDEDVITAAQNLGIHNMIASLPEGYNTDVGETGDRLSFGQKQLISYLRALVSNPRILVLDEATSGLDSETERCIEEATYELIKGRTTLIIAHRLSTVRMADRILYVEGGEIVEDGNHDELIRINGKYAKLVDHFK